jgi:putative membrane protein
VKSGFDASHPALPMQKAAPAYSFAGRKGRSGMLGLKGLPQNHARNCRTEQPFLRNRTKHKTLVTEVCVILTRQPLVRSHPGGFMGKCITATAIMLTFGLITAAQAQAPTSASPDPGAASSPHQRSVTGQGTAEAPTGSESGPGAASSPHQRETTPHMSSGDHMSGGDASGTDPATFVTKAAQGGLTEVAVSKAAAASSEDPKIKQFAGQMVRDHSKANDELSSLAKSKGLQVPASLDAEHQAIVQKLSNKKGSEFDAAYTKQMKEDHAKTVALFQSATKSSDPDLAAFAKKTLPTLMEHKRMAGDLPGAMHSAQSGNAPSTPK